MLSASRPSWYQNFKQIFQISAFFLTLAEESRMVLSIFQTILGMTFLRVLVYHVLCRINFELETPVVDQMRSFYFRDQTGAKGFITDTTKAVDAQANLECMMSWSQGQ